MPFELTNFDKVREENNADVYLGTHPLTKLPNKWTKLWLKEVSIAANIRKGPILLVSEWPCFRLQLSKIVPISISEIR